MERFILVTVLLLQAQTLTILHCPLCNTHMTNSDSTEFELSLDFAALDQYAPNASQAQLLWNGNVKATLRPSNRTVNHFETTLHVMPGENTLSIVGVQGSTGILIDNLKLNRAGNDDNLLNNGDFEQTATPLQLLKNSFAGWKGQAKSAITTTLNKAWEHSTAALILPGTKNSLKQTLNFDSSTRFQTSQFMLTFDYAAQSGAPLDSCTAEVSWNDQTTLIAPKDYKVHSAQIKLEAEEEEMNVLTFKGTGAADGQGLTISNARLISLGSSANLLLNGDFSMPAIKNNTQSISFLPGWDLAQSNVTLGKAKALNEQWASKAKQVLVLDANNQNAEVGQQFNIGQDFKYLPKQSPFFSVSFDYAALDEQPLNQSAAELLFNGQVIAQFALEDRKVHTYQTKMALKPGANQFKFRAKENSSILFSDFQIKREGLKDSITDNGDFEMPTHKSLIPGWTGKSSIYNSSDYNRNWKESKVACLNAQKEEFLAQTIILDQNYRFKTNRYRLELQMAPTEEAQLNQELGVLTWNGQTYPLKPSSYKVETFSIQVRAVSGTNFLSILGQGDDGEGLTVDNVKLTPLGASDVTVKNGGFESPEVDDDLDSKQFYEISTWQGSDIKLGFGNSYNQNWPEQNNQVLLLTTEKRTIVYQTLILTEINTMSIEEPNKFTLSLSYTPEEGKPLEFTGGEIFWNSKLVGELLPSSHNTTSYQQDIQVDVGLNTLSIKAAGGLETYGFTLSNIKLTREGSEDNLIQHQKDNSKVHIDSNQHLQFTQTFEFDTYYRYKTDKLNLHLQYAAKEDVSIENAKGTVHWNDQEETLNPLDEKIHSVKIPLKAHNGENKLSFQGEGLTINNVKVIPLGSVSNVLYNGDFDIPMVGSSIQRHIPSGWNGYEGVQMGNAYLFSPVWSYSSGQAVTLTDPKQQLFQTVTLDRSNTIIRPQVPFFQLAFQYKAVNSNQTEVGEVYWNGYLLSSLNNEQKINSYQYQVDAQAGKNILTFKSKNGGLVITNVKLYRYGFQENIVLNNNFQANLEKGKIPHWKGKATIEKGKKWYKHWKNTNAAVLKGASSLSQEFEFDGNLRYVTDDFVVSFQYGVRAGANFESAKARVAWNNEFFNFNLHDHDLHIFRSTLKGREGNNSLVFESQGAKKTFGVFAEGFDIEGVSVRPFGSAQNVLVNPGFEEPKVVNFDYGMFTSKVPGWITDNIFIGVGQQFGEGWGQNQIIQLIGQSKNAKIEQIVRLDSNKHIIQ